MSREVRRRLPRADRQHDRPAVARSVGERGIEHSQNFLVSRSLVERLVERAGIGPDDLVLEIGPGRGIITEALARQARQVIAVEKDPVLAARLRRRFVERPDVTIEAADFLDVSLPRVPYKVLASIPFNATAEIVTKLLRAPHPPEDAYLVVQQEAAGRFAGRPRESLVSMLLKPWFEPSIVHRFRRTDFSPVPRVDVVMLRLRKRGPPLIGPADARLFRDVVTYGFTAWRPSVLRAFESLIGRSRASEIVPRAGLAPDTPPSAVRVEQWIALVQALTPGERHSLGQRLAGIERRLRQQQQGLPKTYRTRRAGGAQTRRPPPCLLSA
jgi:23S rRNA (adenine-N6)-dimethyltransferase